MNTVPATEADIDTTDRVHDALAGRNPTPVEHLVDQAYVTAERILDARRRGIDLVGPVHEGNQWQSRDPDAFDNDAFAIDWETMTAGKRWPPSVRKAISTPGLE